MPAGYPNVRRDDVELLLSDQLPPWGIRRHRVRLQYDSLKLLFVIQGKYVNPASKTLPIFVVSLFVMLTASAVAFGAQAVEPEKPTALRKIMEQLGRDMQAVTGAISMEDWARVAELAPKIARHAEPPLSEKMRILTWLGTDAGKFRSFDGRTHETASAMGEAAERGDGQAVITAFAEVQQSCLDCHQNFRKPFLEHFHERR